MPRLLWRAGHVLRQDAERRRPRVPANLRRHLRQGQLRQTLHRKTPITAADLLNDRVVPFYEGHGIPPQRIRTDRGTECCGNPERHEYELCLAVEDVEHTRTKARSPQTNGIVERFNKTMLDEFY
jgi:transposase InsO family protein